MRLQRQHREAPLPLSSSAAKHRHSTSEDHQRSAQLSEASSGHRQEWKSASQGSSKSHPSPDLEGEAERSTYDHCNSWEQQERRAARKEKAWRPLSLDLESDHRLADQAWHSRKPTRQEREKRLPLLGMELEAEQETWHWGSSQLACPGKQKSRHWGHSSHRMVHDEKLRDAESRDNHRRGEERDYKRSGHRRHSPSPHAVTQGKVEYFQRDSGNQVMGKVYIHVGMDFCVPHPGV